MSKHSTVDEYIAAKPEETRTILVAVRASVLKGAPDAEESIAYDMPTYKLAGKLVLHFAAWKNHLSVYPASPRLLEAFAGEITPKMVQDSTLKFVYREPVPYELIERIARFRVEEAAHRM